MTASTKPAKKKYLTNKELLTELTICREKGVMSNELARMFMLLVNKYSTKPNWAGYSYIEDMRSCALVVICKNWQQFNPEKSQNPFAFFTQVIKNEFCAYINREKKTTSIKDTLMKEAGLSGWGWDDEGSGDSGPVMDVVDLLAE